MMVREGHGEVTEASEDERKKSGVGQRGAGGREHQERGPEEEVGEVTGEVEGGQRRDGRGHGKVGGGITESHEEVRGR